jgi:hypothetical protein
VLTRVFAFDANSSLLAAAAVASERCGYLVETKRIIMRAAVVVVSLAGWLERSCS